VLSDADEEGHARSIAMMDGLLQFLDQPLVVLV
jgi:hypothetical protein